MRVLLVNGYASRDDPPAKYVQFKAAVEAALTTLHVHDVIAPLILERHRSELDAFVYEVHSVTADPESITRFDQLDFVFVDGDVTMPPWAPPLRKLCTLLKMCMMTGKCFFGAGFSAAILAYLCSTGGELLQAVNGHGRGCPLRAVPSAPPPKNDINSHIVLLDSETGDYFSYNVRHNTWEPKGNTGLVMHTSDRDRPYGARPSSARAGTRKPNNHASSALVSKLADVQCCGRIEQRAHVYLQGLELAQFVVNCPSKWDLDETITHTSGNRYKVFLDSQRGPLLIEFGNALCAHFTVAKAYPATCTILANYVKAKFDMIRVHEHVDRTYVASITGAVPTDANMPTGPFKSTSVLPAMSLDQTAKGRTSPKKCKSVAVSTAKLRPRSAAPTTQPPVYARRLRSALSHTHAAPQRPSNQSPPKTGATQAPTFTLPVRRLVDQEAKKPYCAHAKFEKLRLRDATQGGFYSVVNDGPYRGSYEQQVIDDEKSKLKWVGGPFRTTFGRASSHEFVDDGILGPGEPYDVTHTTAYVLEPERNNHQHPHIGPHPRRPAPRPSTTSLL
ncbi:hypothetical protein SDRG_00266 [Saprolegnia diclina VS20]|uniref:Glutamine amidotransferase domain-containing protein n=1 Tax=Saprolegnia diclina (strain VS20) TaxID=1156394 RepID=T0QWE3_SAPDV|nr:hypothetical protein SDRG_00266 [Saprolegnia diclina VS20]EQC42534.1 hypothetical protein SDRG_00266 [Saprolegnia diclina VS20]|eukprot:XP_008603957.1 hypothetical protein SDRG_00266 [Saprolegnia diclina VS20]